MQQLFSASGICWKRKFCLAGGGISTRRAVIERGRLQIVCSDSSQSKGRLLFKARRQTYHIQVLNPLVLIYGRGGSGGGGRRGLGGGTIVPFSWRDVMSDGTEPAFAGCRY